MRHITVADLPDVRADVEGLRELARNYGDSVRRAHDAAGTIANVWNKLEEHIQAPFLGSFDQVVVPLTRTADRFRSAADSLGGAVNHFAGEVEVMLALRDRLRDEIVDFVASVRNFSYVEPELRWNTNRVLLAQHELLTAQCAGLQTRAQQLEDDFCRSIDAIPSDSEITAGLRPGSAGGRADMVVLPQWMKREANFDSALSDAARAQLDKIAGLSPEQLARWVASHEPLIHELVDSADPVVVAAWAERVNQHPGLLAALIATAPLLMGGLDGLHPTVRAAANVNVARERLAKNEAEIAGLENYVNAYSTNTIARLAKENDYLQRAIDGKVQLYLYDPDRDRIIEMFGNPEIATSRLNWVPGTTTTLDQFYDSFVTDLPSRIAEIEGNSLVFVLKDGKFPQLYDLDATPANTELMNELGSRVARFELGMDAAGFADQHTVAVGH